MKLVQIARALLVLIAVVVAAISLPYYYWMAFDVSVKGPMVSYSPVINKLMFFRTVKKEPQYVDTDGKTYTREEYERLTPLANYRQLAASGAMPESLRGVKLDLKEVSVNNIFMRATAASLDEPVIQLFPMFESKSGRIKIEMPNDVFRGGSRIEFIDAETNTINAAKSQEFTNALKAAGFLFPTKQIAGNPTTRKPFDEGYYMIDAVDRIYHVKMVRGKPFCVNINVPNELRVRKMIIQEMALREFYGLIIAEDNSVYLIAYKGYKLIKLPLDNYDSRSMTLLLQGDLFTRTITTSSASGMQTIVTDRDYKVADRYSESWPTRNERTPGTIASYVFPFTISLLDRNSSLVDSYVLCSGIAGLVGIAVCLAILFAILRLRKRSVTSHWFDIAIVAVTGVFGLIAVHIIDGVEK